MTSRREFTPQTKLAAWKRCGGYCECDAHKGKKHRILSARYDHIVPDWLGGDNSLGNCQVLDLRCDKVKTYDTDIPAIAKSKRIEAKRAGLKRKGRPLAGTKASGIRKRMDGTVVRRG